MTNPALNEQESVGLPSVDAVLLAELEMLRRVVAQAGLSLVPPPAAATPLVDVAHVADLLGVSAAFVREHAVQLGGIRAGTGPRSRWRFEADQVIDAFRALNRNSQSALREVPSSSSAASGVAGAPAPRTRRRQNKTAPGLTRAGNPILDYKPLS